MQNSLNAFEVFINPIHQTTKSLANAILKEIRPLIGNYPQCVIAQYHDRAAAMSGSYGGVQVHIKEIYNNVHLVNCYCHQFNLILQ